MPPFFIAVISHPITPIPLGGEPEGMGEKLFFFSPSCKKLRNVV